MPTEEQMLRARKVIDEWMSWFGIDPPETDAQVSADVGLQMRIAEALADASGDNWQPIETEIRELWPGCSFQIREERNAGFYKDSTRHFEIGVISTQYEVHGQRFEGATLLEALQKLRDFTAEKRLPAPPAETK